MNLVKVGSKVRSLVDEIDVRGEVVGTYSVAGPGWEACQVLIEGTSTVLTYWCADVEIVEN